MANFIKEWTNQEVEKLTRSFRRHSRFVFGLKFFLPMLILAFMAALLIYPQVSGKGGKKIVFTAQPVSQKPVETPTMQNPRFHGVDSKNQPYQINALRGVQKTPSQITLEQVTADLVMTNGDFVAVVAESADFEREKGFVELFGNVEVYLTSSKAESYEIKTNGATIDLNTNVITGSNEVLADSAMGKFQAHGFVLKKDEEKISFKGPVRLVILRK